MRLAVLLVKPVLPEPERLADIGLRIGIIVVVAFVVQRLLFLVWHRIAKLLVRTADDQQMAKQRVSTLTYVIRNVITAMVFVVALIYALGVMGWDVKPLLAGAGILGVALALALSRWCVTGSPACSSSPRTSLASVTSWK